jgi:hypothetical protein
VDPEQEKLSELTAEQLDWINFAKSDGAKTVLATIEQEYSNIGNMFDTTDPLKPHQIAFLQGKREAISEVIEQINYWRGFDLDAAKQAEDRETGSQAPTDGGT